MINILFIIITIIFAFITGHFMGFNSAETKLMSSPYLTISETAKCINVLINEE